MPEEWEANRRFLSIHMWGRGAFCQLSSYSLNVCWYPHKIHVEILTPQSDGMNKWDLWEGIKS